MAWGMAAPMLGQGFEAGKGQASDLGPGPAGGGYDLGVKIVPIQR